MSEPRLVLVTGPTGTVGAPLTELLADRGVPTVAGARDPATYRGPVAARALDFERPDTFPTALAGVRRVFLMRPPAIADTKGLLRPFIVAARAGGVEQVVFLSVLGVNRALPHWQVEQDLRASGMAWTFLRPSFFAQNLETAYRADIRDGSQLRLASGSGRTSFVDTRDVAAVAVAALTEPAAHRGQAYTLTGPAALTWHEVASMLSAELGRTITYEPLGLLARRAELRRLGLPTASVRVQLVIDVVARVGLAARVTDTTSTVLGRPATPLATYLHDRRDSWLTPVQTGGVRSSRT